MAQFPVKRQETLPSLKIGPKNEYFCDCTKGGADICHIDFMEGIAAENSEIEQRITFHTELRKFLHLHHCGTL